MKPSLWAEIHRLYEIENLSHRKISKRLGCCAKTVSKALSMPDPPVRRHPQKGKSKLDSYKPEIDSILQEYPDLSAVRIHEDIQSSGYDGGVGLVRLYLQQKRSRVNRIYREVIWLPGDACQVDWGDCGWVEVDGHRRRVSVFVAVLCYSRMLYIEFTLDQKKETFYRCIRHALEYWGGSPSRIIVDNLKAAVLAGHGRDARFHPEFLDLCAHYRMEPIACQRRDPQSKGMVEGAVRYVKENALAGRDFLCFSDYTRLALHWLDEVANVRRHSTTGATAISRLPEESLRPLPACPADTDEVQYSSVSAYARITFDRNRYSVPPQYAGKPVCIRADGKVVRIIHEEETITKHTRCYGRKETIIDPDHQEALLARTSKASLRLVEERFDSLCHVAVEYRKGLIQAPIKASLHMRQILRMAQLYGQTAVSEALESALAYGAFDAAYVCNLVEQNHRKQHLPEPLPLTPVRKELLDLDDLGTPGFDSYDKLIEGHDHGDS